MSPAKPWALSRVRDELERPLPRPVRFTAAGLGVCLIAFTQLAGGLASAADLSRHFPVWLPLGLGGILIVTGSFLLGILWRQRRLLAMGRWASSTITACRGVPTRNGAPRFKIDYEFLLPAGGACRGNFDGGLSCPERPSQGSQIWVVYDPNHPLRNSPYPMSLVKVASPGRWQELRRES